MNTFPPDNEDIAWQPTATLDALRQRQQILTNVRTFFSKRGYLEVDTPTLSQSTTPDVNISSFVTQYQAHPVAPPLRLYLQTSPEFHMKRLLAAGYGPIYQVCKAFRNGESGHKHNPEFTMIEWYHPGYDHYGLMDEVDTFLQEILATKPAKRVSYADIFLEILHFNPHTLPLREILKIMAQQGLEHVVGLDKTNKDACLDVLLTHRIEPQLGNDEPYFVYDYPSTQASLARVKMLEEYAVAERFEVYMQGMELANGFHELADARLQTERFAEALRERRLQHAHLPPLDKRFLQALSHGLPDCAGIALGFDRLVMLALRKTDIAEVIAFPFSSA